MEQVYKPKRNYRVFVRCNTFNQSKYIEDALNGFAMQQTSFPFVCLVMDDCSTDEEQDVIKAWMEHECDMEKAEYVEIELSHIILVPHKLNKSCTFAFYVLKRNTWKERNLKIAMYEPWRNHCEYEAICEGDDYWIHPQKLQRQADYLGSHPTISLVAGKCKTFLQKEKTLIPSKSDSTYMNFEECLTHGGIGCATCTVMYKINELEGFSNFIKGQKWQMGDFPLWLYLLRNKEGYAFDDDFSVYRVLATSASHSTSYGKAARFDDSIFAIQKFYVNECANNLLPQIEKNNSLRRFHTAISYKKWRIAFIYLNKNDHKFVNFLRLIKHLIFN